MNQKSTITSVLALCVAVPLIGGGIGWGAWLYANSLTSAKRAATASRHIVSAPLHTAEMRAGAGAAQAMSSRTLYMVYCAQCHGETGDGNGTQVLDRPARSFKDGGFSFGNTPTALYRTISNGIGGTPMPAFADTISAQDRRALAEYVRSLAPPELVVTQADRMLMVTDVPMIVRGHLPALGEGLPEHPRGLLVGTTDGLSFEYSADDVRLLAVRMGDFVERTDWTGRGGTPLKPMGQIIDLIDGGQPEPMIDLGHGTSATLLGTTVNGKRAIVRTRITHPAEERTIEVEEWNEAVAFTIGAGYRRHLVLRGLDDAPDASLNLRGDDLPHIATLHDPESNTLWIARRLPEGRCLVQGITSDLLIDSSSLPDEMIIPLPAHDIITMNITTLVIPEWSDDAVRSLQGGATQ